MLEIRIDNQQIDLPAGFSIDLEDTNPVFNDRGSQSVPATVPSTNANERALGFPSRIDAGMNPNQPGHVAQVSDGVYIRRGKVNVTSAGKKEGITFNVGFDNSTVYSEWADKKLSGLSSLPVVTGKDEGFGDGVTGLIEYATWLYKYAVPERDPLAVFPVAVGKETFSKNDQEFTYWEMLNVPDANETMNQPNAVKRLVDGEDTEINVPKGYGISPFVRVWHVLEMVFEDIDIKMLQNPFKYDGELNRLVVLNNAADTICTGSLKYADLMPDCTVSEFLNALWVRFGLVFNLNCDARTVSVRLLRDILADESQCEIENCSTGIPLINYEAPQYVTLSAKTSLDGAAPPEERFEDFARGLNLDGIHLGSDVSKWTYTPDTPESPGGWDGDVKDEYWDWDPDNPEPPEPDYPDETEPDDDRDDERGDSPEKSVSKGPGIDIGGDTPADMVAGDEFDVFLAREFVTGKWYKIDNKNKSIKLSGSPFFRWDTATPGCEPLDLSSDDECVPVISVNTFGTHTGNSFIGKCPGFFAGARHFHSYIKGGDDEDKEADTPLSFMIAYTVKEKSFGRITPEGEDGLPIKMDDGYVPTLSLLFQFKDGLFAKFWAKYDEILRHGNRSLEFPARIEKKDYLNLDVLKPVVFRGIRCLIDTFSYQLPEKNIMADVRLRTITTHGEYDIKAEQKIPKFSASGRLKWFLKSETYGEEMLEVSANRRVAADKYREDTGYEPHGGEGDYYTVNENSAVPVSISRSQVKWDNDNSLPDPVSPGHTITRTYKAVLSYSIYEIHDMAVQGAPEDWELDELIGEVSIVAKYTSTLVARWAND